MSKRDDFGTSTAESRAAADELARPIEEKIRAFLPEAPREDAPYRRRARDLFVAVSQVLWLASGICAFAWLSFHAGVHSYKVAISAPTPAEPAIVWRAGVTPQPGTVVCFWTGRRALCSPDGPPAPPPPPTPTVSVVDEWRLADPFSAKCILARHYGVVPSSEGVVEIRDAGHGRATAIFRDGDSKTFIGSCHLGTQEGRGLMMSD